jgi:hypothetical protein
MRRLKRVLAIVGILALVLASALTIAYFATDEARPTGPSGARADAIATRIEHAIDLPAWERTKAVRWTFAGRNHHLWDRDRNLAQVRMGDAEVLLYAFSARGRAYRNGHEVVGEEARELLDSANSAFINDSFWLNPLAKLRDDGVTRRVITLPGGGEGLLIDYSRGGLTPGDAYLWIPDQNGLPSAWKMWVSVIPIGGLQASWEGWQTLRTGARISTIHRGPFGLTLEVSDVDGAATLAELVERDPFAPLIAP